MINGTAVIGSYLIIKSMSYFFNDFIDEDKIVEIYQNRKGYSIKLSEFWFYVLAFIILACLGIYIQYNTNTEDLEDYEDEEEDLDYHNMDKGMVELNELNLLSK